MFQINPSSGKPIYEQIMVQVKEAILKGYLKQGDSLPSVRKLAMSLSVTPNTVAKAYQILEREKVIVTIRGKGAFVSENISYEMNQDKLEEIQEKARGILIELKYLGFDEEEVIDLIKQIYKELEGTDDENN